MNYRLFLTATAVIILTSMTMAQQPPQSHPLSEIYPVDTDLDMEDYNINNLSQLSLNDGSGNTGLVLDDYSISGEGDAQRFVLDYQNDVWSVENSGLELNGNNLSLVDTLNPSGGVLSLGGDLDLGSGSVDSVSSINSGGSNLSVGSYLDVNAPNNQGSALDVGGTVSADGGIDSYDNVNIDGDLRVNGGEIDRSVYRTDAVVDLGPSEGVLGFSDSFSDGTLDPFQSNTIYTDFTVQNGYANHEYLDEDEYAELNLTTSELTDNYISFRYRTGSSSSHEWTFNATGDVYSLGDTDGLWDWRTFKFDPSSENDFIWRYEGIGAGADYEDPGFEIDDVRIGEMQSRDSMNVFGGINAREGIDVKGGSVNMNGNNVNMSGGNITSSSQMCMGVYCE